MNSFIENPEKKKGDLNPEKRPKNIPVSEGNKGGPPTLSFLSEQLNNLLLDLIELKSELLHEKKLKERLLREVQDLQEEKRKSEQQKVLLNEEIQLLKKQRQETELSLKTLEQQFNKELAEHQSNRTKLRELQEKLHQKEQESIEIATQHKEAEETIFDLTKKIQTTALDLSNALVRIAELESRNQHLVEHLSKQKKLLQNKENEISKFQKENEQLKKQIGELQGNIGTLKAYIETQQRLLEKMGKEKEILLGENRKLELLREKVISEKQRQEEQQKKLEQKHQEIIEQCQGLLRTIEGLRIESTRYQREYRTALIRNEELTKSLKYWQEQVETLKRQWVLLEDEQDVEGRKKLEDDFTRLVLSFQTVEGEYLKLGELLTRAGFITNEQLEEMLAQQKKKPYCRLGTLLLEQEWIDEITLFHALSVQKKIPLLFIDDKHVNVEQMYLLGYLFCMEHLLVPLRTRHTDITIIATAEPDDTQLLEKVKEILNNPIRGVYSFPTRIIDVIEKIFKSE